uniref:Uncharacterized protein n=1 Tax=Rhizophora mucronata TaxID=61149 RepID=A0A2P2QUB5_RHIMU
MAAGRSFQIIQLYIVSTRQATVYKDNCQPIKQQPIFKANRLI